MNRFIPREHLASILVATLSSTFGVVLLLVTGDLATIIEKSDVGSHAAVHFILSFIAWVFLLIALYTAAVVTANTFATVIAGRTKTIALLRLLGASARSRRNAVAREGLTVGLIGGGVGLVLAVVLNAVAIGICEAAGILPLLDYAFVSPEVVAPVVAVVLTTWLASWIGSRRVLTVSPMQAVGASTERSESEILRRPVRNAVAVIVFVFGTLILLLGVAQGQTSPTGLLIAVVGGMISFTGFVLSADLLLPPALRLVGVAFGRSAPARLASKNAVRYPERSARTAVGLVIGVTLVTMFSVALQTYSLFVDRARTADPQLFKGTEQLLAVITIVFGAISGFSAVIAAVGMVNNLNLSVVQRISELGLLRALGFTGSQVRRMIVAESAQLALTSILAGLVLGTLYGWAGAEALMGSNRLSGGILWPAFPPVLAAVIVASAIILVWVASLAPSRRATRITPIDALAVE